MLEYIPKDSIQMLFAPQTSSVISAYSTGNSNAGNSASVSFITSLILGSFLLLKGVKFYPIVHSFFCGSIFFMIFVLAMQDVTGLILGLAAGIGGGILCFHFKAAYTLTLSLQVAN